jgi:uncharacterized membrane protein
LGTPHPTQAGSSASSIYNRADPALFVEKRMGLGYTLNLGNPFSWLVMIAGITALSIPLLLVP